MEKRFELLPPTLNPATFIWVIKPESYGGQSTFYISDLTRSEAEEYAELMKQTFMKHWESKQVTVNRKEK